MGLLAQALSCRSDQVWPSGWAWGSLRRVWSGGVIVVELLSSAVCIYINVLGVAGEVVGRFTLESSG